MFNNTTFKFADIKFRIRIKEGMVINNNLKAYREASGYKQADSARKLKVTVRQYQRLEAKTPKSVAQFHKLAGLYDTTIDKLLEQPRGGGHEARTD